MPTPEHTEEFVTLLTECQGRLYAYIRTLVRNSEDARDVLQETNLVLWRKSGEFEPQSNFAGWACRIAQFQVKAWRRDAGRDRLVFDDSLLDQLSDEAKNRTGAADTLQSALPHCLGKLTDPDRGLLRRRYFESEPVKAIAAEQHRSPNAVSRSLYRIRNTLLACIERALRKEEEP